MLFARAAVSIAAWVLLFLAEPGAAQTYTTCNPLQGSCPPDPALGKSISIDFTKGSVNSFKASGNPTYGSNGASFTVANRGDSPTITSLFYIMFGKVSVTMKAAPGTGIVSSFVLQSDDLDEIDLEWLGGDSGQVQSNFFGKGITGTYNRGAFHATPNNQQFVTYTIEWTADQIIWSVAGTVVRTLTPAQASAGGNWYPQTPMQLKLGVWAGGDSSNAPGTIQWAGGSTDYSKGPFSMVVQSVAISDYSTGTQYTYGTNSGKYQDIVAQNGKVNGNQGGGGTPVVVAGPAVTSASPSIPGSFGDGTTKTGYPWVASATTLQAVVATSSIAGIPSGWTVSSSGKIIPASSAAPSPTLSSLPSSSPPPSSPLQSSINGVTAVVTPIASQAGVETITAWNGQGFLTTMTVPVGYTTTQKCYDDRGFAVACDPVASTPVATIAPGLTTGQVSGKNAAAAASTNAANAIPMGVGRGSTGAGLSVGMGWLMAILFGIL